MIPITPRKPLTRFLQPHLGTLFLVSSRWTKVKLTVLCSGISESYKTNVIRYSTSRALWTIFGKGVSLRSYCTPFLLWVQGIWQIVGDFLFKALIDRYQVWRHFTHGYSQ